MSSGHCHLVDDRLWVPHARRDPLAGLVPEPTPLLAHLLFAATAASTAVYTFCELRLMRVETPCRACGGAAVEPSGLPRWIVSSIWFVRSIWGPGGAGLHGHLCALRALTCCPASCSERVSATARCRESAAGPVPGRLRSRSSRASPIHGCCWLRDDAAHLRLRRRCRRHGVAPGQPPQGAHGRWSVVFFLLLGNVETSLIYWRNLAMPIVLSPLYLGVVAR